MLLVVDFNDTPWITTTADFASIGGRDFSVGTNDGKGDLVHDLGVFGDGLFVIKFVAWALEDLDVMVGNVAENLERVSFLVPQYICYYLLFA